MDKYNKLKKTSFKLRKDIFTSIYKGGGGHVGGSFSIIDALTYLYSEILNIDPKNPEEINRDRLIFSKGHSCQALYWVLCHFGFYSESYLEDYGKDGARFAGHPEFEKAPGIEISSGSLGHGPSIGAGIAHACVLNNQESKIFVIVGDGETNEGSVWEAILCASQLNLNNFYLVIDNNQFESLDKTSNILGIEPIDEKLKSFGFDVIRCNGHDFEELDLSFKKIINLDSEKPKAIILDTIKAHGISFTTGITKWHYRSPTEEELKIGLEELDKIINA